MPNSSDSLSSSTQVRTYGAAAALTQDVNIESEGGAPCRRIRVGKGGDIVMVCNSETVTVPALADGESIDVQATKIVAVGSTAYKITVFW